MMLCCHLCGSDLYFMNSFSNSSNLSIVSNQVGKSDSLSSQPLCMSEGVPQGSFLVLLSIYINNIDKVTESSSVYLVIFTNVPSLHAVSKRLQQSLQYIQAGFSAPGLVINTNKTADSRNLKLVCCDPQVCLQRSTQPAKCHQSPL